MSAAKVVMEARAAGVQLRVVDEDLALAAATKPLAAVLELLSRHKPAIVGWLRPGPGGWSAEDWNVFFDERAGIAEFERGLPRNTAEARAFKCCVVEWLNNNPARATAGRCPRCGSEDNNYDPLIPYGCSSNRIVWLHSRCWPGWYSARKATAIAALAEMGIRELTITGYNSPET